MRVAGIIAEYNPFHNGHAYQIAQLRQMGFDAVVCVCSPSVVQRGTAALFPTSVRTHAALLGGADLVVSLPAPFAVMSAEGFARTGVALLGALGVCEAIAFGAETPDATLLLETAHVLDSDALIPHLRAGLDSGLSFAAARGRAAEVLLPGSAEILATPNNILAVEYCRALQRLANEPLFAGNLPRPLPLARKGAQHDAPIPSLRNLEISFDQTSNDIPYTGQFASATALRRMSVQDGVAALRAYVPPQCLLLYLRAAHSGLTLNPASLDLAVLSRLRALTPESGATIRGISEGLEQRLLCAVRHAATLEELYDAVKTKRYAHARVRRLVLDAALGYTAELPAAPSYLHLLGASKIGLSVLAQAKKIAGLPMSHSLRKLEQTSVQASKIAAAHSAAEDLVALCLQRPQPQGAAYSAKFIVAEKMYG